jgi:hypothetical protein
MTVKLGSNLPSEKTGMTRRTHARIAGFTMLFYMAIGVTVMVLMNRATDTEGTAAILARIAEHASDVRVAILLELLEAFSAVVWRSRCTRSRVERATNLRCLPCSVALVKECSVSSVFGTRWDYCGSQRLEPGQEVRILRQLTGLATTC